METDRKEGSFRGGVATFLWTSPKTTLMLSLTAIDSRPLMGPADGYNTLKKKNNI